jgi:hypothetical protein
MNTEILGSHGGEDDDVLGFGAVQADGDSCVSPQRWHLPTSLHGVKTQNNNIVIIYTYAQLRNSLCRAL